MSFLQQTQRVAAEPHHEPMLEIGGWRRGMETYPGLSAPVELSTKIHSFLVSARDGAALMGQVGLDHFSDPCGGYTAANGRWVPGRTGLVAGVKVEAAFNYRTWENSQPHYFEPTEDMVLALGLHRVDCRWVAPPEDTAVIRMLQAHGRDDALSLSVRKAELFDYLRMRQLLLFVMRYLELVMDTDEQLAGVSERSEGPAPNGHYFQYFGTELHRGRRFTFMHEVWQSFVISPPAGPRRASRTVGPPPEFTVADGRRTSEFEKDYLAVVTIDPSGLESIAARARHTFEFTSRTMWCLTFGDGSTLPGAMNTVGEMQTLLGYIGKLSRDAQATLAPLSGVASGRLSVELAAASLHGEWVTTDTFEHTLVKALHLLSKPWIARFGEALLLAPGAMSLPSLMGPTTEPGLLDDMRRLRVAMVPEKPIPKIKAAFDLSSGNADDYAKLKSLGYLRRLVEREGLPRETLRPLEVVETLRNAISHPRDVAKDLERLGLASMTPRRAFHRTVGELIQFLVKFQGITASLLTFDDADDAAWADLMPELDALALWCHHMAAE